MRIGLFFVLVLATCLTIACSSHASAKAQSPREKVVQDLIAAIGGSDQSKLVNFIKANFVDDVPAEQRAQRLSGLASQGAPFKFIRIVRDTPEDTMAEVEDKNGMSLSWTVLWDHTGKIQKILVQPFDANAGKPPKDYSGWTDLSSLEEAIRADTDSPAMSIAMLHDGKVTAAASGVREVGKPGKVTTDDAFSIGSIGKSLCSTVIGRLVEMGKLRWDETLAEALPDTPMKADYKQVTIDEVLHHRGGIFEMLGMRKPEVDRIVSGATDRMQIRDNLVKDLLNRDPIGKPNEKFAYSNGGYAILGHIAETTMKKPYEQLVREMIFEPLGMTHSYTGLDTLPKGMPSGHVHPDAPNGQPGQGSAWQPMNFGGPMEIMFAPAGGGMYCSASDLLKFGEMHMNGLNGKDGLLKASTVQRLHQGIPEDLVAASPSDVKSDYTATPQTRLYACGWGIEANPGLEIMHTHNGSNGTQRAQIAIFPKSGLVVVAFVNCGGETDPSPPLQACLAIGQRYAKQ